MGSDELAVLERLDQPLNKSIELMGLIDAQSAPRRDGRPRGERQVSGNDRDAYDGHAQAIACHAVPEWATARSRCSADAGGTPGRSRAQREC